MAGITLEQAEAKLAEWMAADTVVSQGQAYTIAGRTFNRTDAQVIRENIEFWEKKIKELDPTRTSIRMKGGTPSYER